MTTPPADPFGGQFRVEPIGGSSPKPWERRANASTLYQFALALVVLYLIMRYVPRGEIVGATIFAAALLSSPEAVKGFSDMLTFIQNPARG